MKLLAGTGQELKEIEKINKTPEAQLAAEVLSNQGETLATDGSYLIQLMLWGKNSGENWGIRDSQIGRVNEIEEALILLEPKQVVKFSNLLEEIISLEDMKEELKASPNDLAIYLFVNSEGCLQEMDLLWRVAYGILGRRKCLVYTAMLKAKTFHRYKSVLSNHHYQHEHL